MGIIYILIALTVMIGSGFAVFSIVEKKIPLLLGVKYSLEEEKQLDQIIKEKIKKLNPWQYFKFVKFLEDILVKIREWIIKAGGKTNEMIKKVQEKHEIHSTAKDIFSVGYWQELKEKKISQRRRVLRDEDLNKILKK
ncbi:MAG TPA: hypothetical protein PLA41_02980 [Candidatus Pacearchaeota archaeon]|nr:hypothetical protein [Candidatus Pacearchaeota archaeon]HOU46086.1 hypothetical protein [Candidatus Pacearchaeota archaeon]HPM08629.1 hypothetical protein [Candidatus Pacearchaeota archaeon]HQI74851.1 hypothetical protein [Candidatus Pacearchaeota archaeon]